MASKTITIDIEAYLRLRQAREAEDESFSRVIKRAVWTPKPKTAGAFLAAMKELPPMDEAGIEFLIEAQRNDLPPDDPWNRD